MNLEMTPEHTTIFSQRLNSQYPSTINSYSSSRNILTNDSRNTRTFPLNLQTEYQYKPGIFNKTQPNDDEYMLSTNDSKTIKFPDTQLVTSQCQSKVKKKKATNQLKIKLNSQALALHNFQQSFTARENKIQQQNIKYQDFREKHQNYYSVRNLTTQLQRIQQNKKEYNDFAIGGNMYNSQSREKNLLLYKPSHVKLSTRSSINIFVKDQY